MAPYDTWGPRRWAQNGAVHLAFDEFMPERGGEPLLLVTGLGANRRWLPDGFCEQLTEHGFAVARYDHRDSGDSTHLPRSVIRSPLTALLTRRGAPYTAEDMADDAIAVLDELGWSSAHWLGMSLGGAVVQRVALRHPARVRTLTTVDAVPGDTTGVRTLRYIRLRTLAKFTRVKFPATREGSVEAGATVANLLSSPNRVFDETAVRARLASDPDSGIHDREAQSRQIGAQWSGPAITEVARPTLVVHGEDDPLIKPAAAHAIVSRIPASRLLLLPGAGHDLPDNSWRPLATAIQELARCR